MNRLHVRNSLSKTVLFWIQSPKNCNLRLALDFIYHQQHDHCHETQQGFVPINQVLIDVHAVVETVQMSNLCGLCAVIIDNCESSQSLQKKHSFDEDARDLDGSRPNSCQTR